MHSLSEQSNYPECSTNFIFVALQEWVPKQMFHFRIKGRPDLSPWAGTVFLSWHDGCPERGFFHFLRSSTSSAPKTRCSLSPQQRGEAGSGQEGLFRRSTRPLHRFPVLCRMLTLFLVQLKVDSRSSSKMNQWIRAPHFRWLCFSNLFVASETITMRQNPPPLHQATLCFTPSGNPWREEKVLVQQGIKRDSYQGGFYSFNRTHIYI